MSELTLRGKFNKDNFANEINIKEKIKSQKDIFNRKLTFKRIEIDHTFPKYITENKEKLKEWII